MGQGSDMTLATPGSRSAAGPAAWATGGWGGLVGGVRVGAERLGQGLEWAMGVVTLGLGLAALAVVPGLNLLSLGYLLEASARVARSGRWRDGWVGVRKAAEIGQALLGIWLVLWPVRFCYGMWQDAELIAAGSEVARGWRVVFGVVAVLAAGQVWWAGVRGGQLRHFLWPAPVRFVRWARMGRWEGGWWAACWGRVAGLRLGHYFMVGWCGLVGGVLWLAVPVGLLMAGSLLPPAGAALAGLAGGALLFGVVLHLPFLQTLAAVEGRFGAMFEWRRVGELAGRAPLAFAVALGTTLVFALPLYLLKIEFPPREIAWLPSVFFVGLIFPARLLTGWAVGRALRRDDPGHWFWCWAGRLGRWPVVAVYVVGVYLTQYLSWHGVISLVEQHAFLVPAPMLSL